VSCKHHQAGGQFFGIASIDEEAVDALLDEFGG
jgi:hypothetical protein